MQNLDISMTPLIQRDKRMDSFGVAKEESEVRASAQSDYISKPKVATTTRLERRAESGRRATN